MTDKNQIIFSGFKRLRNFPLDPTSTFETYKDLEEYVLKNKTIYPGQTFTVYMDEINSGFYIYINNQIIKLADIYMLEGLKDSFMMDIKEVSSNIESVKQSFLENIAFVENSLKNLSVDFLKFKEENDSLKLIEKIEENKKNIRESTSTFQIEIDTLKNRADILQSSLSNFSSSVIDKIELDEFGNLSEIQKNNIPTVKAVYDLLQNYEIKNDEDDEEDTDDSDEINSFIEGEGWFISGAEFNSEMGAIIISNASFNNNEEYIVLNTSSHKPIDPDKQQYEIDSENEAVLIGGDITTINYKIENEALIIGG